ncbi:hypothetical protein RF11_11478 [Thelohanellus kitauei]|uniref:Uncharacterized protein n=1 Tax=Thelohanellus kitauei TaxID=669202 RepID=A0A0C2MWH5_THEKT|nr:hypothetical protein RF11_03637 [Thelohanellus kitauei]KII71676.1 hypothetical protein RF11_11478 [Thelohanellus kitauei]
MIPSFTPTNINEKDQIIYVSNDGGRTVIGRRIMNKGLPVYLTSIQLLQDHMFCVSDINSTFVYIDRNFKESHFVTYEKNALLFPHPTKGQYIAKLVPEDFHSNPIVSQNVVMILK